MSKTESLIPSSNGGRVVVTREQGLRVRVDFTEFRDDC